MPIQPDFVPWLKDQVDQWADRYCPNNPRRAFPAWALHFTLEIDDDDAFNLTDTLTQGDAGLDGWSYERDSGVFHLIQAKYLDDPIGGSVSPGDLDPLFRAVLLLRNPELIEDGPHHEKLTAISLELGQAILDDAVISLDFYIAGKVSQQGRDELTQAAQELDGNYSVVFYDTERFYEEKLSDDPIADLAGEEVRFQLSGDSQHYEREDMGLPGVGEAAVVALDGRSLADAVAKWQARLFHANVRYYLRKSNKVNKDMLATLNSDEGKKAFWLYNNGLTIVADEFEIDTSGDAPALVATNPQIVNGAQTSSVLRDRRAHLDNGDVSVQARVIAVHDSDEGKQALERISETTNSQSPVNAGDLKSNELRHREIQTAFDSLNPKWFYERRRGEWLSLPAATKGTYGGRKVTKEDVGQRYLAFVGHPAVAVSRKNSIFDDLEAMAFDPTVSAQVYLLAYTIFGQADELMKDSHTEDLVTLVPGFLISDGGPEESETPQLDSLRRAHKLVCAHAAALVRRILQWRYDDLGITGAQVIRERVGDNASSTYAFVWRYAFRTIRQWHSSQADLSALKATLQRTETLQQMIATLSELLVEADPSVMPPI